MQIGYGEIADWIKANYTIPNQLKDDYVTMLNQKVNV